MSFILTKNAGVPVKYLIEGYVETAAELTTFKTDFTLGSKIITIDEGKEYVLTEEGWTYLHDVTVEEINKLKAEIQSLSKLKNWLGDTTTPLYDGSTANPIVINREDVTAQPGDVARYDGDQFIFSDTGAWQPYDDQLDVYTKDEIDAFLAEKVDKIEGKGLSTNDFTNEDKNKVDGALQRTGGQVTGDVTTTNTSFTDTSFVTKQYVDMQSITYSALKTLRDNSQLVPGKYYRITDYQTTTVQEDTQSAGNQFDVVVRANDSKTLDENAGAIRRSPIDYFYNQNLAAWQLKYDIDNDTDKYAWADSTNGKGVIYWMKDEYDNECSYDFKNIQMKFYKVTATTTTATDLIGTYCASKLIGGSDLTPGSGFTIDNNDYEFRYTFDLYQDNTHKDYSLNRYNSNAINCYDNTIEQQIGDYKNNSAPKVKRYINIISFRNTAAGGNNFNNRIGHKNYNMSFGGGCYSNTFGDECHTSIFGDFFIQNTFKNYCMGNKFGNSCNKNIFGNNCNSFTGNTCTYNTFGNRCQENTFNGKFHYNSFGNYCYHNTFSDYFRYNTMGNYCDHNTFNEYCEYNIINNGCKNKTISANTSNQTIGVTNFTDDVTTSNTVFGNTSFITKQWVNDNAKAITDVTVLPTGSAIKNTIYRLATTVGATTTYTYYLGDAVNQTTTQIVDKSYVDQHDIPYWEGTRAEYEALTEPLPEGTYVFLIDENISYNELTNRPQINGTTLTGNKSASDLGLASADGYIPNAGNTKTGDLSITRTGDISITTSTSNDDISVTAGGTASLDGHVVSASSTGAALNLGTANAALSADETVTIGSGYDIVLDADDVDGKVYYTHAGATPIDDDEVATKGYIDTIVGNINSILEEVL